MSQRRYDEAEVAAIFERAAESLQTGLRKAPGSDGLTLAELQDIGREVGIPAESIALAAQSLEPAGTPTSRRFLGFTVGVGRTVQLERRLSDQEWERLVVDLRETFDARGKVTSHGSLRQWTNGNLHVLLEPTESGHRVRMRTTKGDATGMLAGGLGIMGAGAAVAIAAVAQGAVGDVGMLAAIGAMGAGGIAMFASTAFRLPGWAQTRERQMEELAARLLRKTLATMDATSGGAGDARST